MKGLKVVMVLFIGIANVIVGLCGAFMACISGMVNRKVVGVWAEISNMAKQEIEEVRKSIRHGWRQNRDVLTRKTTTLRIMVGGESQCATDGDIISLIS